MLSVLEERFSVSSSAEKDEGMWRPGQRSEASSLSRFACPREVLGGSEMGGGRCGLVALCIVGCLALEMEVCGGFRGCG